MMELEIFENVNLQAEHSFHLPAKTRFFTKIQHPDQLFLIKKLPEPHLILGGGSNLFWLEDFSGTVIKNELKGQNFKIIDEEKVIFTVASGENWHKTVLFSLQKKWGGLENLSLIPGTVGAAPIQNIGAYGVELKDILFEVEAFHLKEGKFYTFSKQECSLGYRESIFKNQVKNQFFITKVSFILTQKNHHIVADYAPLQAFLKEKNLAETPENISRAVIAIRQSKLPDPAKIGNAGSFFKNPVVKKSVFEKLLASYPQIPHFFIEKNQVKIPAAWLIEQCGWKGKTIEARYGVHALQALVLVHYQNATGQEIWALAQEIIADVKAKMGVELEPEVNVVGR